jgi:small nuclear ribonucleoprotein
MSVDMAVKVLDESINQLLDSSEEIPLEGDSKSLGTIVVRGDNVVMISPPPVN